MTEIRSAMIFAAGFGTRMGDLTTNSPKPLVPIAGRPMIDYTIDLLRDAGITNIVANAHYLSDQMVSHLARQDVAVSVETDRILDTGGGLRAALPMLGNDPVITINPDAIWLDDNPIPQLLKAWQKPMQALLMLAPYERAFGTDHHGDFSLEDGKIARNGPNLYGGAQIIDTTLLDHISSDVFSLNAYWDRIAKIGRLHGIAYPGRWCDIGSPDGLTTAEAMMSNV